MITPKLEQLIWEGKAFFKTYIAGPVKSTLNIDNDRFIIITDITFSGFCLENALSTPANIQLNIYGEKGFNHYIFRNINTNTVPVYDQGTGGIEYLNSQTICQPITLNTYLLHTTQVGFSFGTGSVLGALTTAVASESNPSYSPPLDYGKNGDPGAVAVPISSTAGTMNNQFTNRLGYALPDNVITTQQIQYTLNAGSVPSSVYPGYCFANINYVEILGQPENIMF